MNRSIIKKIIALCVTLSLLICGVSAALADSNPLIYKVSDDNGNHIYLLGTIHVGRDDMYPIAGFDGVLSDCDAVALEIYNEDYFPPEGAEDEFKWSYVTELLSMIDLFGTKPDDELMAKLKALPGMEEFSFVLPYVSLSTMTTMVLYAAMDAAGVDAEKSVEDYVVDSARRHNLELMGLETEEEQNAVINSQSEALMLAELEAAAEDFDGQVEELNTMLDAWSAGDRASFLEEEDIPEDDELAAEWKEFDQKLSGDRNLGFLEDAEGFLREGKTVLIAIGADHVYAADALVDMLTERGYHVEELGGRM